jgi:hypothetical protein
VPRWLKFIVGLTLLPVCAGGAVALWRVVRANGTADETWIPLLAGAVCWGVVYLLLPRPMWFYVAGHELTHALWVWAFGGRVKRVKISSSGGHVIVSKTNFIIALAPYFFPFYAVLVVLLFLAAGWFWPWQLLQVWFHLALGAAYAFHLTLTGHVLKTQQSDIVEHGRLFSATVILLGNLTVLLLAVPLLTHTPGAVEALQWWGTETLRVVMHFRRLIPG